MTVDTGIWSKLNRILGFLLLATCVAAVVVWYLPLFKSNEAMRKEILRLKAEVEKEEDVGRRIERSIKALNSDPRAIERVAREKLGYVLPGETMIRFEPPERPVRAAK